MEKKTDHIESVAEELRLNGFDVTVIKNKIEYDTIAGTLKYSCAFETIMEDYYRFIQIMGGKLQKYGLESRLKLNK